MLTNTEDYVQVWLLHFVAFPCLLVWQSSTASALWAACACLQARPTHLPSLPSAPTCPLPPALPTHQDGKKRMATVSIIQILALVALFFLFAYFWVSLMGWYDLTCLGQQLPARAGSLRSTGQRSATPPTSIDASLYCVCPRWTQVYQLRPFMRRAKQESRRVAELL